MTTYIIIASLALLISVLSYFRNKQAKNKIAYVIDDNCTRCQFCIKKCRHKAIELVNSENDLRVVISPNKCTACGDCIPVCKSNALELISRKQTSAH